MGLQINSKEEAIGQFAFFVVDVTIMFKKDFLSDRNHYFRVRLDYGGGDITQIFFWLLQKCAFPYKECRDKNKLDTMLLRKLKEDFCHVNLDICGSQEKSFVLKQPDMPVYHFTIQVGDECIIAPLSLFSPELFAITGTKLIHTQKISTGDPEDPHDEIYLRDIRKKGKNEQFFCEYFN